MDLIPNGRSKYREQGASSLPRLDAAIAHGGQRIAAGFLVGGGLIPVVMTALPNYLHDSRWSTIVMLGMAVPTVLAGLVVLRLGIPARAVLPIAALGDLMVGLVTLTAAGASAALLNTASLAVLMVFTVIFGTRRDLIVQSVFANVVLISVAHIGHPGISEIASSASAVHTSHAPRTSPSGSS